MPKNKKVSSRIYETPYSKTPFLRTTKNSNKDYEEIRCSICFEHPHDAVLLICSSYNKGCRPFMCNTRCQFNCLGQYRDATSSPEAESGLRCPLCRGHVSEERAVEDGAREFMNRKTRSCERCEFVGNQRDLEMHWWVAHSVDELARLIEIGYAVRIDGATSAYDELDDDEYDDEYDIAMSAYATPAEDLDDDVSDATSADVFHRSKAPELED